MPALQNINGGTLHEGVAYLATNGGKVRGIFAVDITTGESTAVVNNYRGRHLNSPNDLVFDSAGNIWFTDPDYGHLAKWDDVLPPQLPTAIYRFNPRTGALHAASNSVVMKPNGLAFSPDEKTLYVADSSTSHAAIHGQRGVFAFDVTPGGLLSNPTLVHLLEGGSPDGLRVTEHGLLLIAGYAGIHVVAPQTGTFLGIINMPDDVIYNIEPAGRRGVWLATGKKHIYKVTIQELPVAK